MAFNCREILAALARRAAPPLLAAYHAAAAAARWAAAGAASLLGLAAPFRLADGRRAHLLRATAVAHYRVEAREHPHKCAGEAVRYTDATAAAWRRLWAGGPQSAADLVCGHALRPTSSWREPGADGRTYDAYVLSSRLQLEFAVIGPPAVFLGQGAPPPHHPEIRQVDIVWPAIAGPDVRAPYDREPGVDQWLGGRWRGLGPVVVDPDALLGDPAAARREADAGDAALASLAASGAGGAPQTVAGAEPESKKDK